MVIRSALLSGLLLVSLLPAIKCDTQSSLRGSTQTKALRVSTGSREKLSDFFGDLNAGMGYPCAQGKMCSPDPIIIEDAIRGLCREMKIKYVACGRRAKPEDAALDLDDEKLPKKELPKTRLCMSEPDKSRIYYMLFRNGAGRKDAMGKDVVTNPFDTDNKPIAWLPDATTQIAVVSGNRAEGVRTHVGVLGSPNLMPPYAPIQGTYEGKIKDIGQGKIGWNPGVSLSVLSKTMASEEGDAHRYVQVQPYLTRFTDVFHEFHHAYMSLDFFPNGKILYEGLTEVFASMTASRVAAKVGDAYKYKLNTAYAQYTLPALDNVIGGAGLPFVANLYFSRPTSMGEAGAPTNIQTAFFRAMKEVGVPASSCDAIFRAFPLKSHLDEASINVFTYEINKGNRFVTAFQLNKKEHDAWKVLGEQMKAAKLKAGEAGEAEVAPAATPRAPPVVAGFAETKALIDSAVAGKDNKYKKLALRLCPEIKRKCQSEDAAVKAQGELDQRYLQGHLLSKNMDLTSPAMGETDKNEQRVGLGILLVAIECQNKELGDWGMKLNGTNLKMFEKVRANWVVRTKGRNNPANYALKIPVRKNSMPKEVNWKRAKSWWMRLFAYNQPREVCTNFDFKKKNHLGMYYDLFKDKCMDPVRLVDDLFFERDTAPHFTALKNCARTM